jgi:predicted RNase H-like HicB family nuclease
MRDLITTAEIWKEGNMYTSYCPELDIASCGHTPEEARKNLQEVITIQLEETKKMGTLDDLLSESGYTRDGDVVRTGKKIVCFEELRIPVPVL